MHHLSTAAYQTTPSFDDSILQFVLGSFMQLLHYRAAQLSLSGPRWPHSCLEPQLRWWYRLSISLHVIFHPEFIYPGWSWGSRSTKLEAARPLKAFLRCRTMSTTFYWSKQVTVPAQTQEMGRLHFWMGRAAENFNLPSFL